MKEKWRQGGRIATQILRRGCAPDRINYGFERDISLIIYILYIHISLTVYLRNDSV